MRYKVQPKVKRGQHVRKKFRYLWLSLVGGVGALVSFLIQQAYVGAYFGSFVYDQDESIVTQEADYHSWSVVWKLVFVGALFVCLFNLSRFITGMKPGSALAKTADVILLIVLCVSALLTMFSAFSNTRSMSNMFCENALGKDAVYTGGSFTEQMITCGDADNAVTAFTLERTATDDSTSWQWSHTE